MGWDRLWRGGAEGVKVTAEDVAVWRAITRHVDFAGRSVVELGCGRGLLSYWALEAGAREATLVDASPAALRIARGLIGERPGVRYVEADLLAYAPPEAADIVLSSGVVEHFRGEDLRAAVGAHSRCRERAAIVAPAAFHPTQWAARRRLFVEAYGHEAPLGARKLAGLMRRAGLEVVAARRFAPLYNVKFYWLGPYSGRERLDARLRKRYFEWDLALEQGGWRRRAERWLRGFERVIGGLVVCVGRPRGAR